MSTSTPPAGMWSLLPPNLKTALILAVVTSLLAGASLFRTIPASELPSEVTGDGDVAAPNLADPLFPSPSATPVRIGGGRSSATISVPGGAGVVGGRTNARFPTFGTYVFDVTGTEQGGALSRRSYPAEMRMTVHRDEEDMGTVLEKDELVFDLEFSPEHREREIVSYDAKGMTISYEDIDLVFNSLVQTSEATFDPALLQIPAELFDGASVSGTSTALDPDGTQRRVEEWSVDVDTPEEVSARGDTIEAWVVTVSRRSSPSDDEQFSRTRKYWYDQTTGIWVKWEEQTSMSSGTGLGRTSYSSQYTAVLDHVEPL